MKILCVLGCFLSFLSFSSSDIVGSWESKCEEEVTHRKNNYKFRYVLNFALDLSYRFEIKIYNDRCTEDLVKKIEYSGNFKIGTDYGAGKKLDLEMSSVEIGKLVNFFIYSVENGQLFISVPSNDEMQRAKSFKNAQKFYRIEE